MLVSEAPRDPGALNDLAWLYLTSDDTSLRNPQRGLELRYELWPSTVLPQFSIRPRRRFQNGRPEEAVKLEREALDSLPSFQEWKTSSS